MLRYYLTTYSVPLTVSLALHLGLVAVLTLGWEPRSPEQKTIAPRYIEAKLVELKTQTTKRATTKKKPNIVDLTAKKLEQDRQKRLAEKQRLKALIDKKNADDLAAAQKKALQEQALLDAQRDQALLEKERLEQLQQEFDDALLEEEGLLLEEEYASEAQSYADLIRRRIEQNWSRPPSARNGMRCELTIDMVPNGQIIDVNIKTSSGDAVFDRSAVAAVKKVGAFPEVKNIPIAVFERHFRQFSLGFQPEDLRQ